MFATYDMMKRCTNDAYLKKGFNELIVEYRNTTDARERNRLIATIFCKVYPMILKIQKPFYMLTPEQKMEHALYHLVKSLENFDSKKMLFSSFYHLNLTRQLRTLLDAEQSLKRCAIHNVVKNNDEALNFYIQNTPDKKPEETEESLLRDINNATFLSSEEKEYCACIVSGIEKTKEIAKAMKIDKKFNLRRVTNPLIPIEDEQVKKKLEKALMRKTRQIRDSIREKKERYAKDGIDIFRD